MLNICGETNENFYVFFSLLLAKSKEFIDGFEEDKNIFLLYHIFVSFRNKIVP